ncbi:MAG: competence/damage-inducible protein A [Anaerolineales bacterium]
MSSASGEILTIGTELLLGEIVDGNSAHIARTLKQAGINVYGMATVGDNVERISRALLAAVDRADFIITTGGLGPTVDDMTRQGVAEAAGVGLEFRPELWMQVKERFARYGRQPDKNNRRQAHLPEGASGLHNPIGTAPGFKMKIAETWIYALPGVPAEMKHLLHNIVIPELREIFSIDQVLHQRLLHTAGVGESALDSKINDLETWENPTLGLAAHPGRVDLRLTARAETEEEAEQLLDKLEAELHLRIRHHIHGRDDENLESVVLDLAADRHWRLVTVEAGTQAKLAGSMMGLRKNFLEGILLHRQEPEALLSILAEVRQRTGAELGLALLVTPQVSHIQLSGWIRGPGIEEEFQQAYGGPPDHAAAWGASLLLERLRQRLK